MDKMLNTLLPVLAAGLAICTGCVVPEPWTDRPYGPSLYVPPVGGAAFEEPVPVAVPAAVPVASPLYDEPFYEESVYFSEPRYLGRPLPPPHAHGRRPLPPPHKDNLHRRPGGDMHRPIDRPSPRLTNTRPTRPTDGNKFTRPTDSKNVTRPIRPQTNGGTIRPNVSRPTTTRPTTTRPTVSRPTNNDAARNQRPSGNRNGGRVAPIRRR